MSARDTTPQHPPAPASRPRLLRWLLVALPALVLAVPVVFWFWAASPGSLATTLSWVQRYLDGQPPEAGRLHIEGAEGSLRLGGSVALLRWTQDGLTVQAQGVRLLWTPALLPTLLTQRRLDIAGLHADRLDITDERPPAQDDSGPPTSAELPLRIDLPWSVDALTMRGNTSLALSGLRGHYAYGPAAALGNGEAHQLRLDGLHWADGDYQGTLVLGAHSPMPLRLQARGQIRVAIPEGTPQELHAQLRAEGALAHTDAALDARLLLRQAGSDEPAIPAALDLSARILPWHAQHPVAALQAQLHRLNLAGLWPQAPQTALSGHATAHTSGTQWLARVQLDNERPSPADQGGLPLGQLRVSITQEGRDWRIHDLQARIGEGSLRGEARLRAGDGPLWQGPWSGRLLVERIDPSTLWSALIPGHLDGTLDAQTQTADGSDAFTTTFNGQLARSPQAGRRASGPTLLDALELRGQWQARTDAPDEGRLTLDRLRVRGAGISLQGRATLNLANRHLEGTLDATAPGLTARWQGLAAPATGQGELAMRLDDAAAAQGWMASLQVLPLIGPVVRDSLGPRPDARLKGQASAVARWQGGLAPLGLPAPAGTQNAARPLRLDLDVQVPALSLQATADTPAWELRDTRLQLAGPPTALDTRLTALLRGAPGEFTARTRGTLQPAWPAPATDIARPPTSVRLQVDELALTARPSPPTSAPWRLNATQAFAIDWRQPNGGPLLETGAVRLALQSPGTSTASTPARLAWEHLRWHRGALSTQGSLDNLPLAWADLLTANGDPAGGVLTRAGISTDLMLQGRWELVLPEGAKELPRVQLNLERQSGDLTVHTDALPAPVTAGVRTARLDVGTQGQTVQGRLQWETQELGQIEASVQTALSPPSANEPAWHWPEQAPLSGQVHARLPEAGVWSALAPPGWRVQGSLDAQVELAGTRAEPRWGGTLDARQLAVSSVVEGIAFTGGQLLARLDGDRLRLERLHLQGPGGASEGGVFEATGSAIWRPVTRDGRTRREPLIDLQATARQLRVSNRPDRRLTLTGDVQARLDGPALDVRGTLTADNALFILPDEFTPKLGADVVVRLHGERPVPPSALPVQTHVDVQINLGQQFEVRGQGLATRLVGRLNVLSTPALPGMRVVGEVRTRSGTYRAYGQQLAIETGILRFSGPYDDPALDIVAIRPNLRDQRVGVRILGTAQRPQVNLFSDPDMADSEKLAWLMLGRPATGAGAEAAVLQQAALALLSGTGEGVGSRVAGFLGLDQLDVVDRGEAGDALSMGKRFSNRLYLSYERGLLSTLGTVAVFYDLSRWLTLRARAGEENAIDLIFQREFD